MFKYRVFSGPYFPAFRLNTERYGPKKTLYLDTFHSVIGQGYSGQKTFTSLMNLPKPVTANNYDKIINTLVKTTKAVAGIIMQDPCEELRADSSSDTIKDVEVPSDGIWQRREIFLIKWGSYCNFLKNGIILDIEPVSRKSR